ncbi:MAG TPA: hypothetical protein VNC78_00565 [Actinomycetota bacterium]|nr:hypothetical protein [Actinomycetota bacterium]
MIFYARGQRWRREDDGSLSQWLGGDKGWVQAPLGMRSPALLIVVLLWIKSIGRRCIGRLHHAH